MEKKIIQKPVFQTVKTGEKPKTIYVANDGREFDYEKDCVEWERMIDIIAKGEKELTEIKFEEDAYEIILRYVFGAADSSNVSFWKWTATKDEVKLKAVIDYLNMKQKGRKVYPKTFDFPEGSTVIISSWTESEQTDYPDHYTRAVDVSLGMDIIETLTLQLKSAWQLFVEKLK